LERTDSVAPETVTHVSKIFPEERLTRHSTHVFLASMLQRHTTANTELIAAPPPARDVASLLVLVLITSPTSAGRTGA